MLVRVLVPGGPHAEDAVDGDRTARVFDARTGAKLRQFLLMRDESELGPGCTLEERQCLLISLHYGE